MKKFSLLLLSFFIFIFLHVDLYSSTRETLDRLTARLIVLALNDRDFFSLNSAPTYYLWDENYEYSDFIKRLKIPDLTEAFEHLNLKQHWFWPLSQYMASYPRLNFQNPFYSQMPHFKTWFMNQYIYLFIGLLLLGYPLNKVETILQNIHRKELRLVDFIYLFTEVQSESSLVARQNRFEILLNYSFFDIRKRSFELSLLTSRVSWFGRVLLKHDYHFSTMKLFQEFATRKGFACEQTLFFDLLNLRSDRPRASDHSLSPSSWDQLPWTFEEFIDFLAQLNKQITLSRHWSFLGPWIMELGYDPIIRQQPYQTIRRLFFQDGLLHYVLKLHQLLFLDWPFQKLLPLAYFFYEHRLEPAAFYKELYFIKHHVKEQNVLFKKESIKNISKIGEINHIDRNTF